MSTTHARMRCKHLETHSTLHTTTATCSVQMHMPLNSLRRSLIVTAVQLYWQHNCSAPHMQRLQTLASARMLGH